MTRFKMIVLAVLTVSAIPASFGDVGMVAPKRQCLRKASSDQIANCVNRSFNGGGSFYIVCEKGENLEGCTYVKEDGRTTSDYLWVPHGKTGNRTCRAGACPKEKVSPAAQGTISDWFEELTQSL